MRLLLLLMLAGCPAAAPQADLPPTAEVTRGAFDHTLTVTGEIQAVDSQKIVAPLHGKITELAEEGDVVKKDQVVVRFDMTETEREVATLQQDIDLKNQEIEQKTIEVANNIENLRRALEKAELNLQRIELKITDSETVSRIEREEARLNLRDGEIERDKAKQELDAAVSKGDADVSKLRLEKRQKEDKLARKTEEIEKSALQAPTDGLVILGQTWRGGKIAEGDQVWRGVMIMEIPDLSVMEVLALVHEVDAAKVAEEQLASVRLDAMQGRAFTGKVSKKARLAKTKRKDSEVKYFDVTVALDESDPEMKPGMTTKVDLVIEQLEDVVMVPREALVQSEGKWTVFVKGKGGKPDEVEVQVGARNATHVVVEEGVTEGQAVFLGAPNGHQGSGAKAG